MAKLKRAKAKSAKQPAKVVAMHRDENDVEKKTILQQAAIAEKNDDLELAEQLYRKQSDEKAFNASVYTRLMIVLRKQKKYKEEVVVIKKGLQHFKEHTSQRKASKNNSAAVKRLSNSLNKSLGLTDKKGNDVYEPEPIPTWKKRLVTVQKKLK